jgi:2-keto-4-pentenoate hydratase/2-oxohepta-3-ene-1,7-dioic acid hydratase in catechol pathway
LDLLTDESATVYGMKSPIFLKKGDVMTLGIEGLGEQRQLVVPFKL